jgi:predicted DNA-binding transcriptional regulator AlpA
MRRAKRGGTIPSGQQFPEPQKPVPLSAPAEVTGPVKILTKQEVLDLLHVSDVTLWTWIRDGNFPPSRVFGPGQGRRSTVGWIATEVYAWIANAPRRIPKGSKVQP